MAFLLNINRGALIVPIERFQENAFIEDGTEDTLHYNLVCEVNEAGDYQALLDTYKDFCIPESVVSVQIFNDEKLFYSTERYDRIAREDLIADLEGRVVFNINFDKVINPIKDVETSDIIDTFETYEELDGEKEQVGG